MTPVPIQSTMVRRTYYGSGTVTPQFYDDVSDGSNDDVLDTVLKYGNQFQVSGYTWDENLGIQTLMSNAPAVATYETPAYANSGGTGDRQSLITVTVSSANMYDGDVYRLVDGIKTNQGFCSPAPAGEWIKFQFPNRVKITEFTFYGGLPFLGTHTWQGSDDDTNWTNVKSFTYDTTVALDETADGFMYHRILHGELVSYYFLNEFEFKIANQTNQTEKNILFCGDSKTVGVPELLIAGLKTATLPDVTWVESTPRQATAGWTVDALRQAVQANIASVTPAPDFVLINIGINDAINNAVTEAQWKADMQDILTAIHNQFASTQIYLMRPWATVAAGASVQWVTNLHTWIDDIVALNPSFTHVGPDEAIFLENGDNGATYTSDGIHPTNPAGRQLTANQWKTTLGY